MGRYDGSIAAFQDGAWTQYAPQEGWQCWLQDEERVVIFSAGEWRAPAGPAEVALFGVNTAADATNRLSVKADAVLHSHDDVTPGTGNAQHKINKASAEGTSSLLFQTAWSGRAEIGTTGDDDLRVKVSPDGIVWHEALVMDRATGAVSMPNTAVSESAQLYNLFKDAGRFGGSPEPTGAFIGAFAAPGYLSEYNGSTFAAGPRFIYNNNNNGGTSGTLAPEVDALVQKLKDSAGARRYGVEFHLLEVTAGPGTANAISVGGVPHYLTIGNAAVPIPPKLSLNFHLIVTAGRATRGPPHASMWPKFAKAKRVTL